MTDIPDDLAPLFADLLLALADDKLMLGHRNSDWTGLGPILEEDIAFSSLAQDEMAHAQAVYELVGALVGADSNDLAFGRDPSAYRCAAIVEVADEFDWAVAIGRQLFCDHFDALRLNRLSRCEHAPVAALAKRMAAEEQIHCEHVDAWVRRLGRGTDASRERMQAALDRLGPIAASLLEPVEGQDRLEAAGLYPVSEDASIDTAWADGIDAVVRSAGLTLTVAQRDPAPGGRRGVHTELLGEMLNEMCEVYRIEPGAAW